MKRYIIVADNGVHYIRSAKSEQDARAGFWNEYHLRVVEVFVEGDPAYWDFRKREMAHETYLGCDDLY